MDRCLAMPFNTEAEDVEAEAEANDGVDGIEERRVPGVDGRVLGVDRGGVGADIYPGTICWYPNDTNVSRFFLSYYITMPGQNVTKAALIKTIPSNTGCTLLVPRNREQMIANRFPKRKDCSSAKTITLAPVGGTGSKLLFKGGSK